MALSRRKAPAAESGQTTTEYVLLLSIVAALAFLVLGQLKQMNLAGAITAPLTKDFVYAYRYGHPKARGPDEGGYQNHPRGDPSQFRIFFNPGHAGGG